MAKKTTDIKEGKQFVGVPIEWNIPVNHVTPFASNIVVQVQDDIFKISFFEIKPPFMLSESEQPAPSKIMADCVASVFVTPNKIGKIIELLQIHLDKYKARKKRSGDTP